jgi:hypothetical protein
VEFTSLRSSDGTGEVQRYGGGFLFILGRLRLKVAPRSERGCAVSRRRNDVDPKST